MTITYPAGGARVEVAGNGVSTSAAITFPFWLGSDLYVVHTDSSGTDTVWVYGVDFNTTGGSGTTGAITYSAADLASGEKLTILLKEQGDQPVDVSAGAGQAASIEGALDKAVSRLQREMERVDRAPKLKASTRSDTPTFPEPAAGQLVGWNSGGTDLENRTIADIGETFPSAASSYLKRNSGGTAFQALTPGEVLTDILDGKLPAAAWDSGTTYTRGQFVVVGNVTYYLDAASSTNEDPTSGAPWVEVFDLSDLLSFGSIDNTPIGQTAPAPGAFTTVGIEHIVPVFDMRETDSTSSANRVRFVLHDAVWQIQRRTDAGVYVSSDYMIYGDDAGAVNHIFKIGNVEAMRVTEDGLGIGKTPSEKLDVNGTVNATGFKINGVPLTTSAISQTYVSPEQTITLGGTFSLSHGLGVVPKLIQLELVCKAAEGGYSVGDVVVINNHEQMFNAASGGFAIIKTSSQLLGRVSSSAPQIIHNSTSNAFNITVGNWRLVVRAFA